MSGRQVDGDDSSFKMEWMKEINYRRGRVMVGLVLGHCISCFVGWKMADGMLKRKRTTEERGEDEAREDL